MTDRGVLGAIDGPTLAAAFSAKHHPTAMLAGEAVARMLITRQWTELFTVQAEGQSVLIPARLHFASHVLSLNESDEAWYFARALQTRSNDGFERQRAARDLLAKLRPSAAPFIVALIGEYIIEILDDISIALTPETAEMLATFISQNEAYWNTTKRRVASYWDVYYRSNLSSETRRAYTRNDYVGFKLIDRLEVSAFGNA